jgi:hypothetical protein
MSGLTQKISGTSEDFSGYAENISVVRRKRKKGPVKKVLQTSEGG